MWTPFIISSSTIYATYIPHSKTRISVYRKQWHGLTILYTLYCYTILYVPLPNYIWLRARACVCGVRDQHLWSFAYRFPKNRKKSFVFANVHEAHSRPSNPPSFGARMLYIFCMRWRAAKYFCVIREREIKFIYGKRKGLRWMVKVIIKVVYFFYSICLHTCSQLLQV